MSALAISNVVLWVLVIGLAAVVLALARQVGVLHERIAPVGALMLNRGLQITLTAGAIHINGAAGTVEELLRETDIMLGRAKRSGRNMIMLRRFPYEPEPATEAPA